MRRIKSLFLILVALWLPLQTAGAAAMPVQFAHEQGESCHLHDMPDGEMTAEAAEPAADCDNCRICHLASAGFLLAASVSSPVPPGSVLVALPTATLPSHIGDPPLHPPRRLN